MSGVSFCCAFYEEVGELGQLTVGVGGVVAVGIGV